MTVAQDLQKSALPGLVQLFTLDLNPIGVAQVFHFTPTPNGTTGTAVFGGVTYTAFPIQAEGFEVSGDGSAPQPTLRVSNITRYLQSELTAYQDIVGAKVTRTLTFETYLDTGSTPDSSQVFGVQSYLIQQLVTQNKLELVFRLCTILDRSTLKLPREQVLRKEFPGAGLFRTE